MSVTRIRTASSLVALVAVVLAGCGGSAANDYRGKVNDVKKKYDPQITALQAKVAKDSTDAKALSTDMKSLSTLASSFATDIEAIKAPSGKEQLAAALVAAERQIAKAASSAGDAAAKSDTTAMSASLTALQAASDAETAAIAALNKA